MMQFLFPVVIGALLLGLLLHWSLRSRSSDQINANPPAEVGASGTLHSEFLPVGLMERILDPIDRDFTHSQATIETIRLLEQERRALAIYWLRHTRHQVRKLMSFHVRSVRRHVDLSPGLEIQLALNYVAFLIAYRLVMGLFYIRNPFHVRRVVNYIAAASMQLCFISERLLLIPGVARSTGIDMPPSGP